MTSHAQLAGWEPRYAARAERMRASEIRELLKLLDVGERDVNGEHLAATSGLDG